MVNLNRTRFYTTGVDVSSPNLRIKAFPCIVHSVLLRNGTIHDWTKTPFVIPLSQTIKHPRHCFGDHKPTSRIATSTGNIFKIHILKMLYIIIALHFYTWKCSFFSQPHVPSWWLGSGQKQLWSISIGHAASCTGWAVLVNKNLFLTDLPS
jgi:hypothetical protein